MRKFGLIGALDDEGVSNVGGRIGAARGPLSFAKVFSALKGFEDCQSLLVSSADVLPEPKGIEQTHARVCEAIKAIVQKGLADIVVGGGHDFVLPQIQAYSELGMSVGCLNIDAHFDLRKPNPKITSGSPFYLAIEKGYLKPEHLVEFGIQKQSNNKEVKDYSLKKKIKTIWFDELREGDRIKKFKEEIKLLEKKVDHLILSIDLDAFSEAFAPGVSAPQSEGFTSAEGMAMVEFSAGLKKNNSLGIFELNPIFDQDLKTARLAATLAWKWIGASQFNV